MPFRAAFDCLWCGAHHEPRTDDDIEGWAQLCPACVGRAGENGFLRFRLRAALDERGRARAGRATVTTARSVAAPTDDWYLHRGGHSLGAIGDATWASDLDAATLWVDATPLHGRIVEIDAGDGWWSPLLAVKGELWAHAASQQRLENVRARLVAHGLRAHIHVGEPDLDAGPGADGVFVAFRLGRLAGPVRADFLRSIRAALRPGGALVAVDLLPRDPEPELGAHGTRDIPRDASEPVGPEDGIAPALLDAALREAGFEDVAVERTSHFFVLARASA